MSRKEYREVEVPTLEQLESLRSRYQYKQRYNRTVFSTTAVIIVAASAAILIATYLMPVLRIYGHSMTPTLDEGQIVLTLKSRSYAQGDLVAFYYGNKLLVKRVIASPSDWISIVDNGDIFVNGQYLEEPYLTEKSLGECDQSFPMQISDGHWFLMGDNRSVSVDSRSVSVGCVSQEQIVGKIVLRIWPISDFGTVD